MIDQLKEGKQGGIFKQVVFWAMLLFSTIAHAQIKVACIGNSITFGAGITHADSTYPAQLGKLLGNKWEVNNFGIGGATLLRNGNKPYCNQPQWRAALAYQPDVVIIKLGTNDSKPYNWKYAGEFTANYLSMIDSLRQLPSMPMIFICYPVPAFPGKWGIRDSIIRMEILPLIRQVAMESGATLIDLYRPLMGGVKFFPDAVHPNEAGAARIAKIVAAKLKKSKRKMLHRKETNNNILNQ